MNVSDIYKTIDGTQSFQPKFEGSETKKFLDTMLTTINEGTVINDMRKRILLVKTKGKRACVTSTKKPRKKKTILTLTQRKRLGLYKLPKKGLKFEDYLPLHNLWCDYMRGYINIEDIKRKRIVDESVSLQLLKADYHGAILQVKRSRCPSLVGTKGILLMDTKNTFQIICPDNVVRTIPKEKSMFTTVLDGMKFTIFGKHLQIKPIERSTKKIKNRSINDL